MRHSQSSTTAINLPTFDGPLDLLLHLIERNELDITGVSLAKVAEQFLVEVERLKGISERIETLMEFIVVGAQLALIKSRALLPQTPVTIEGEDEEDPAEALARRLREYKQFKEMTQLFKHRESLGLRTYLRITPFPVKMPKGEIDMTGVSIGTLQNALLEALSRAESLEDSVKVAKKPKITIEGQISRVRQTIKQQGRFQFKQLLSDRVSRAELSVTLLAVLECIKRHEIVAQQTSLFGPIEIVSKALIREDEADFEGDRYPTAE